VDKTFKGIIDKLKQSKLEELYRNDRVLIVDSLNTFLRSFVVVHQLNPQGTHIGGMVGFLKSLGHAIEMTNPTRVILVFDGEGGSTNKRNLYPEYKANRHLKKITNWDAFDDQEEESEAITNQIVRLIQYLKCLPVDIIVEDKIEADDVIGYITKVLRKEVFIMSSDKDYIQLVNDKVTVYSPIKKKFYNPATVEAEFGIPPVNYLTQKILLGDKGDHVPSIKDSHNFKPEFLQFCVNENVAQNYSFVLKIASNLLKNVKQGMQGKRLKTGLGNSYLLKLLNIKV
jgi:5'-3' exonuclease